MSTQSIMHAKVCVDIHEVLTEPEHKSKESCEHMFRTIYAELHRLAHQRLFRSYGVDTINTTVLVNETYLKLANQCDVSWDSKSHFLALSAIAMRQIVINYAEQKHAQKRGGDWERVTLDDAFSSADISAETLLIVDTALKKLAEFDKRLCSLVEMRFFAGMTEAEISDAMGVTQRTVRRDWRKAKALLSQILASSGDT